MIPRKEGWRDTEGKYHSSKEAPEMLFEHQVLYMFLEPDKKRSCRTCFRAWVVHSSFRLCACICVILFNKVNLKPEDLRCGFIVSSEFD